MNIQYLKLWIWVNPTSLDCLQLSWSKEKTWCVHKIKRFFAVFYSFFLNTLTSNNIITKQTGNKVHSISMKCSVETSADLEWNTPCVKAHSGSPDFLINFPWMLHQRRDCRDAYFYRASSSSAGAGSSPESTCCLCCLCSMWNDGAAACERFLRRGSRVCVPRRLHK